MKFYFMVLVLTVSYNCKAQNLMDANDLLISSYSKPEKNDSIFQNNFKTYNYLEYEPFTKLLIEGILADKCKKFSAFSAREWDMNTQKDTLSEMDIKQNLGFGPVKRIVFDNDNKELYTEILETLIDTTLIKLVLGFEERWMFDAKKLKFEKEVLNVLLHREYFDEDAQKVKRPFVAAIPSNSSSDAQMKKMVRISYEQSMLLPIDWVENELDPVFVKKKINAGLLNYSLLYENENFDSHIRKLFFQTLCGSVLNGTLSAVDFITHKPLTNNDIVMRLGGGIDKVLDMKIPPQTDEFDAVIFTEDWFMDLQTISFKKIVKEIALVKYSYTAEDKDLLHPQRYIVFSVILNE